MYALLALTALTFARGTDPVTERAITSDARPAWEWLAADGVRPGLWITHPPMEFAIDVLGAEAVQACALQLGRDGRAACAAELAPCQRLVLPATGLLRLEIDAACLQRALPSAPLQPEPAQKT